MNVSETNLITREKWPSLSLSSLQEQASLRLYLIDEILIGKLYKDIMYSEYIELEDMIEKMQSFHCKGLTSWKSEFE